MGKKVPVPVENIAFERLDLSRHYLVVDCDFTCFLVLNPSGEVPVEGTDICALHTGAWQIDAWKLLTKKDFPNQAGFVACLVWDKTLISDSVRAPACVESDIDTANSVSSLKGQPVNITGFSMPSGEVLPVNVYSGDSPVSDENPLSTRGLRWPFEFRKGNVIDSRCRTWCSNFFDRGEYTEFWFYASIAQGDTEDDTGRKIVCAVPWFFSFIENNQITKYDLCYPPVVLVHANNDTHEISFIRIETFGSLKYASGAQPYGVIRLDSDEFPNLVVRVFRM